MTPTNYLELVKGYRALLAEKSTELGSSANKLANGLAKLEDAKQQVETLSKELEVKKVIVAQSQKDCEDLLVQIVSERRIADEQKKQVEADSERIGLEAAECKAISDDAEADLAMYIFDLSFTAATHIFPCIARCLRSKKRWRRWIN